jgi:glycosyltransferase involved in cell wall biosynthesis
MSELNIAVHGSYIGTTGINYHFREFFRELSQHCNLRVRNFTVGDTWKGLNKTPHDKESYLNDTDRKILYRQSLWTDEAAGKREAYPIYNDYNGSFDLNIVADIVDHCFFYDEYKEPKIAYTVWESTLLPTKYFNRLKEFDEVWAASQWQKNCMVKQGLDEDVIQVVPAGVHSKVFFPEEVAFDKYYRDGRFKFVIFGRWSWRKATREMIETFLKTFDKSEPVDLIVSVDNQFPDDSFKSTEDRLKAFDLQDDRIKIVHYASREEYVKFIKKGHVYLSCSRGEGWGLPLCEAMACGTPAIYSDCSAQLEFARGRGHSVKIVGEILDPNHPDHGDFCEPDFQHLAQVMREVYTNYAKYKRQDWHRKSKRFS